MFRAFLVAAFLAPMIGAANAADAYAPASGAKDSPVAALNSVYFSVGVGAALTDTNVTGGHFPNPGDFNLGGAAFDARTGIDHRFTGSNLLVGAFVGAGVDDVKGNLTPKNVGDQNFHWDIGARAGYVVNNTALIYALVGFAQQHIAITNTGATTTLNGIEAGGGVEIDLAALTGKTGLFVANEAEYRWYGDWVTGKNAPTLKETELSDMFRLGIRF